MVDFICLFTFLDPIGQGGHPQIFVQGPDTVADKLTGIEFNTVNRLLIDPFPERLELFFLEVGIQRVGLRLAVIIYVGRLELDQAAEGVSGKLAKDAVPGAR